MLRLLLAGIMAATLVHTAAARERINAPAASVRTEYASNNPRAKPDLGLRDAGSRAKQADKIVERPAEELIPDICIGCTAH